MSREQEQLAFLNALRWVVPSSSTHMCASPIRGP